MKNPLKQETAWQIRLELLLVTILYVSWLVATFYDKDRPISIVWVMRIGTTMLFILFWRQGLRRMKEQGRKP